MKFSFKNKHILITGGSCEPAQKLAQLALNAGFSITLTASNSHGIEKLRSTFSNQVTYALLDFNQIETLSKIQWKQYGYLVDFAHPEYETLMAASNIEKSSAYFNATVSFRSALLKEAVRGMLSNKEGRVIFISSTASTLINPGQGLYAASKAAGEKLYQSIGIEMGKKGITSAILQPGYINSGRGQSYLAKDEQKLLELKSRIPTGRFIEPIEIAESILFLLSDSALQINATLLRMDGGLCSTK